MLCLGKFVFLLVKLILINIIFPKSKEQLDWKNKEYLTILLFYDEHEKLYGKQEDRGSIDESTYLWGIYFSIIIVIRIPYL